MHEAVFEATASTTRLLLFVNVEEDDDYPPLPLLTTGRTREARRETGGCAAAAHMCGGGATLSGDARCFNQHCCVGVGGGVGYEWRGAAVQLPSARLHNGGGGGVAH